MCYLLYLCGVQPLPVPDARYPLLTVQPLDAPDAPAVAEAIRTRAMLGVTLDLAHGWHGLQTVPSIYEVSPEGLCGCYFEHPTRADLEQQIQQASVSELRTWVSTVTYPERDPKDAARQWWERKHTAVTSLGRYLRDQGQNGPLLLYVVWAAGADELLPSLVQQTITPAYFMGAERLVWPEHMLFTIVPERTT